MSTYTSNQKVAIATLLAEALLGLTTIWVANVVMGSEWASLMVFVGLVFVIWILIPLYLKRIKPAFIAGIFVMLIALTMLSPAFMPLTEEYSFFGIGGADSSFGIFISMNLYNFTFTAFDLVGLAFMYFSYKSYKEIRSHSQRRPTS